MGKDIKMRLLALGKRQVDLLPIIHQRGYKSVSPSKISSYINGHDTSPQAGFVIEIINDTLTRWENN